MPYREKELIGPQEAKRLMTANAENQRNIKWHKVAEYAAMMESGQWIYPTGETLKIDVTGRFIDGQNRMQAVIESGCQVFFDIADGLPAEAMLVLDSGASRSAGDALTVLGVPYAPKVASIVRWSLMWDKGYYRGNSGRNGWRPSRMDEIRQYQEHMEAYDSAASRAADCARARLGPTGPSGTAHYLFTRIDEELTNQFFDQVVGGENLFHSQPTKTLRERLLINSKSRDPWSRSEQLAAYVRAWNAVVEDKTLDRIVISNTGKLTTKNFPLPLSPAKS